MEKLVLPHISIAETERLWSCKLPRGIAGFNKKMNTILCTGATLPFCGSPRAIMVSLILNKLWWLMAQLLEGYRILLHDLDRYSINALSAYAEEEEKILPKVSHYSKIAVLRFLQYT